MGIVHFILELGVDSIVDLVVGANATATSAAAAAAAAAICEAEQVRRVPGSIERRGQEAATACAVGLIARLGNFFFIEF